MSSATPVHSVPLHGHPHGHAHETPAAVPPVASRPPLTLLGSGLAYRLGGAAALAALLWAVVLWALA